MSETTSSTSASVTVDEQAEQSRLKLAQEIIDQHKRSATRTVLPLSNRDIDGVREEEKYVLNPSEYLRRVRMKRASQFNVDSRQRVIKAQGFEPVPVAAVEAAVPALDTVDADHIEPNALETVQATVLALDSKNLPAAIQNHELQEASNSTLDYTSLFGSTWESLKDTGREGWRERWALKALHEAGIITYNPWSPEWKDTDAKSEALAMATASVLALRIENSDIKDGSLGSMLELSIAIYSAMMRGQRVVVSIEEGIEKSLTDPGARAQLASLKESLEEAMREHPGYITREDNIERFLAAVKLAAAQQKDENKAMMPILPEQLYDFYSQRHEIISAPQVKVLFGGSGDAFTKDAETVADLDAFRQDIEAIFADKNHFESTALYRGIHRAPWDAAYASGKEEDFRDAHRKEKGIKKDAGVVINMVTAQSRGMGFLNEIGTGLSDALESGQPYALLLEDFDADLYVHTALAEKSEEVNAEMLGVLRQNKQLKPEAITEAIEIMYLLKNNPGELTFSRLKKSQVFKETAQFRVIDNTRRVRVIAQEQMRNLASSLPLVEPPDLEMLEDLAPLNFGENMQLQQAFELLQRVKFNKGLGGETERQKAQKQLEEVKAQRQSRLQVAPVPLFIFETDRAKFKERLQNLHQEIRQAQAGALLAA